MSSSQTVELTHPLDHPDYSPADCPAWIREVHPAWVEPLRGINGLPEGLRRHFSGANAPNVLGVDRHQANQFIPFRPETAQWLYEAYTPESVHWPEGYQPVLRRTAQEATWGASSAEEKALRLLYSVCRRVFHPVVPPGGAAVEGDRNLDEEALLASGTGWCNEQARVFIRLCQAVEVPARMVHYFYSEFPMGHTVAEFHNGHGWCLADPTYGLVFRGKGGKLLSAADCHDGGAGEETWVHVWDKTMVETERMGRNLYAHGWRPWKAMPRPSGAIFPDTGRRLHTFAIINYPLPPRG